MRKRRQSHDPFVILCRLMTDVLIAPVIDGVRSVIRRFRRPPNDHIPDPLHAERQRRVGRQ